MCLWIYLRWSKVCVWEALNLADVVESSSGLYDGVTLCVTVGPCEPDVDFKPLISHCFSRSYSCVKLLLPCLYMKIWFPECTNSDYWEPCWWQCYTLNMNMKELKSACFTDLFNTFSNDFQFINLQKHQYRSTSILKHHVNALIHFLSSSKGHKGLYT